MLLRHEFLEGSLATLYFRRAFDLGVDAIDPVNDTMTIPVAAAAAGPIPLRTYHSGTCCALEEAHSLTRAFRDPIAR